MSKKSLGKLGEAMAADFLKAKGYKMIEKNFSTPEGEIDLICEKNNCYVFIEVKTRTTGLFGQPEEAITETKLEKIERLAGLYCEKIQHPGPWRVEVVAIVVNPNKKSFGIKHLTDL